MNDKPSPIQVELLSASAFQPYGRVIEHEDAPGRHYVPEVFERACDLTSPAMWVRRVRRRRDLPMLITHLERHPYSAQTFLPTRPFLHLVVVCLALPDGKPDRASLRVFVAGPGQGVCYRRNVWHHGLTVLDDVADFIVIMNLTGKGDDDVFLDLDEPVEIHDRQGLLKEMRHAACL